MNTLALKGDFETATLWGGGGKSTMARSNSRGRIVPHIEAVVLHLVYWFVVTHAGTVAQTGVGVKCSQRVHVNVL